MVFSFQLRPSTCSCNLFPQAGFQASLGLVSRSGNRAGWTRPTPSNAIWLELLESGGAEVCVEALAVDGDSLELAEIRAAGDVVILVAFVAFEFAKLNAFRI